MSARKAPSAKPAQSRAIVITRIFNAPRALVFAAWTQPEHLKQWSAPHGFTVTQSEGELSAGGAWRAGMRTPDGQELRLGGVYREIVPNELLVFTHAWMNEDGTRETETLVTVRFSDIGGKTKMVFRQSGFASEDSRAGHRGGWSECFERLAEHLAARKPVRRP